MYFAINEKGSRICIDDAIKGESYFCPFCSSEMIMKCGDIITPHFAHKSGAECDKWYSVSHGKGEWHRKMQSMFAPEEQEVKIESDILRKFKIADVFIQGKERNTIIEFQHSVIPYNVLIDRTKFYYNNSCLVVDGKKHYNQIIWVFDYSNIQKLFIDDDPEANGMVHAIWTGRRPKVIEKFFDDILGFPLIHMMFYAHKNKFVMYSDAFYTGPFKLPDANARYIFADVIEQEDGFRVFHGIPIETSSFAKRIRKWS